MCTHADFPSLSSFTALAPFLDSSEATFSASPCSTAASRRSSFLFHSLTFDRRERGRTSDDDLESQMHAGYLHTSEKVKSGERNGKQTIPELR